MRGRKQPIGYSAVAFCAGALSALILPLWIIVVVQAFIILYFGWLLICR